MEVFIRIIRFLGEIFLKIKGKIIKKIFMHCVLLTESTYVHTVGELKDWTLHRACVVKPP